MNNKKCPSCGFINFVTAEHCRKCEAYLKDDDVGTPEPISYRQSAPHYANLRPYQVVPAKRRGFPILKGALYLVVGLVLVSAGMGVVATVWRPASKIEWREFHPPQGRFAVMMPGDASSAEPVITPLPTGNLTTYTYGATVMGQGSVLYCVISIPLTISATHPMPQLPYEAMPAMLDAGLNEAIKGTNSTLVSKKSVILYSNPALEFEIRPPGNLDVKAARGFGKMFFLQDQEYLLLITAGEGSDLLYNKDKFLNPIVQ